MTKKTTTAKPAKTTTAKTSAKAATAKAPASGQKRQIKIGAALPSGCMVDQLCLAGGFSPEAIDFKEFCGGGKVIVVGQPGAFTPCWSTVSIPGYLEKETELKEKGVEKVVVVCVNDAAVMTAWAKDQKVTDSIIKFVADQRAEATKGLGLAIVSPPEKFGFYPRTKRFAMLLVDGVVKTLHVCETADDKTGDSVPEASLAAQMLADLESLEAPAA